MKRLMLLMVAWLTLMGTVHAQVPGMNIGYCDGQVATAGRSGFNSKEKNVWVSGAIYIPAEELAVYAGNHIDVVRAGLASIMQIDTLRVWVRESLDGENLSSATITTETTPKLQRGWNDVTLDEPVQITENTPGLYLGYSYHQKGSTYGLGILRGSHENALFVDLATGQWQDRSSEGILCVEGIVRGDFLPRYNLVLEEIKVQKIYSINSGQLDITATVRNIASETITAYDAVCKIGDYEQTCTARITQPIAYNERQQVKFTIEPTMITTVPDTQMPITVTLTNLQEGEDEDMTNNTAQSSFIVFDKAFKRNVIIEEFTTEKCPNCPAVANMLHNVLAKPQYKDDVFMMEHHSGYYTDGFTTSFDQSYTWFYNDGGSTYAPAVMYDRYEFNNENTPVSFPNTQAVMENRINLRMDVPALVDVNIKAAYKDDGKLAVKVTGERSAPDFTIKPARITVFLVEDNLTTNTQSGASGAFTHHNVGRKVNSTWGEELQWQGNNYQYQCEFTVPSSYVKDNLGIIAIITDYNSNDPTACEVANAALLRAADFGEDTTPGDVTGDGNVDIADVNEVINMMLGKVEKVDAADITGDGNVDIADVNGVINIMLGK